MLLGTPQPTHYSACAPTHYAYILKKLDFDKLYTSCQVTNLRRDELVAAAPVYLNESLRQAERLWKIKIRARMAVSGWNEHYSIASSITAADDVAFTVTLTRALAPPTLALGRTLLPPRDDVP